MVRNGYHLGWHGIFFPMIIVPILIVIGKIESPLITLAGTYTMGIFSVSVGMLNLAIKNKKHHSLAIFSLAISVFLYGTIFSDPVSPETDSGINVILLVQVICLIILTLLLIRMAFVGVKFARKSKSSKEADDAKNEPKKQLSEQEQQLERPWGQQLETQLRGQPEEQSGQQSEEWSERQLAEQPEQQSEEQPRQQSEEQSKQQSEKDRKQWPGPRKSAREKISTKRKIGAMVKKVIHPKQGEHKINAGRKKERAGQK